MGPYQPRPESLAEHRAPDWFRDAKLGVMVTWGLYSVPAWAPNSGHITDLLRTRYHDAVANTPYAEWYENSLKFPDGPTAAHHARRWPGRAYADFRREFEAALESWRAEPWAELFAAAGARYVVPVTKHHDSYTLWPSAAPNPLRGRWSTPRDVVGEIASASRAAGLRFGVYYSGGLDWTFDPRPVRNLGDMLASMPTSPAYRAYVLAHYAELIERYDPDLLWNDIGYPNADDLWPLLAGYYNGREDRAVNDRFGPAGPLNAALQDEAALAAFNRETAARMADPALAFAPIEPPVFDYRTPEYAGFSDIRETPWECVRGLSTSFGHKANDETRLDGPALARLLADVVSKNGNLLVGIGPDGAGAVTGPDQRALLALGGWLGANGPAVYGTRPWRRAEGVTGEGRPVRFTRSGTTLHAIVLDGAAPGPLRLTDVPSPSAVRVLGAGEAAFSVQEGEVVVQLPGGLQAEFPVVLALDGAA